MCRQTCPEMFAYSFWNTKQRLTAIKPSYKLNPLERHQLLRNDIYVRNTIVKLFGFHDNNVFAE